MIVSLSGLVEKSYDNNITVNVNGVGYGLLVSLIDLNNLESNQEYKFFVYEYIREQSDDLYGFLDLDSKELFVKLINVNGVGPKVAISILSLGSIEKIKQAINQADIDYIQHANGVGKRVAERIIIDLKDKVNLALSNKSNSIINNFYQDDDAVRGLMAMGYNKKEASDLLSSVDKNLSSLDKIKQALRGN